MNNLERILGITFPYELEVTSATNSTNKVKKGAVFFGLPGSQNHGSKYIPVSYTHLTLPTICSV